jgi:MprA protease rhombosortase-interaction domain-containing protein
MAHLLPILIALAQSVPPLTPGQMLRLAKAVDGGDHREDAFAALLENVRVWKGESGDAPIRLQPNFEAMAANPDEFRGDLCRIGGVLAQHTQLAPPFEHVQEWFVRLPDGRPVITYVSQPPDQFADGHPLEIDARFYKRIDFVARDGQKRSYAAFVGAFPRAIGPAEVRAPTSDPYGRVWLVAAPILAMLVVFAGLLIYARRRRASAMHRALPRSLGVDQGVPAQVDSTQGLPDDPAQALAELKRQADGGRWADDADH